MNFTRFSLTLRLQPGSLWLSWMDPTVEGEADTIYAQFLIAVWTLCRVLADRHAEDAQRQTIAITQTLVMLSMHKPWRRPYFSVNSGLTTCI